MRFYLDNDVDAGCRRVLTAAGHECWSASEAGRSDAKDDEQTVYAGDQAAVLITHDREFTERRKKNTIGQHMRLCCEQPDGPELLALGLADVVTVLERRPDVVIELRPDGHNVVSHWK